MRLEDITTVAQDYLKVVWTATEWGGDPISAKALAERFGTTQANVSETARRLAAQGLVVYRPYKPIVLTADGTRLALTMVRRHRLVETFLVHTLGYSWDEVHDEAERLEHAVSDTMIDRIDILLGHPTADPHGDPIPQPDGSLAPTPDTIPLDDADPGRHTVIRVCDTDPHVLDQLSGHQVAPGATVLIEPDPVSGTSRVLTGADGAELSSSETAAIRVGRTPTPKPTS